MSEDRLPRQVVLLHGWGGSFTSAFAATGWLERLAEAGRVVVPLNLPGHDRDASHEPSAYADLTSSLAERLPPEQVDLVGFSLGAKLALSLAIRWSGRIGTIVLGGVGDNAFAPEPSGDAVAFALLNGIQEDTPSPVAALVRYSEKANGHPRAFAAVLRRPANPTLTMDALGRVHAPVLLVNGDRDTLALPDERLRTALADLSYRRLSGIDHLSLTGCAAFQDAAIAFLTEAQHSAPRL